MCLKHRWVYSDEKVDINDSSRLVSKLEEGNNIFSTLRTCSKCGVIQDFYYDDINNVSYKFYSNRDRYTPIDIIKSKAQKYNTLTLLSFTLFFTTIIFTLITYSKETELRNIFILVLSLLVLLGLISKAFRYKFTEVTIYNFRKWD